MGNKGLSRVIRIRLFIPTAVLAALGVTVWFIKESFMVGYEAFMLKEK